jgi:hypothetical protein
MAMAKSREKREESDHLRRSSMLANLRSISSWSTLDEEARRGVPCLRPKPIDFQ